jgi:hypothetical protein
MSVNATSHRTFAATAVVVACAALGCGGNVIEIVSSDAATGSSGGGSTSGVGGGSSGSGSNAGTGSGAITPVGCEGGTCLAQPSSSSSSGSSSGAACTCPGGCCDTTHACFAGVTDQLCGHSGGACTDCTASGLLCNGGTCVVNPSTTCIGDDASACQGFCGSSFESACCKGYGGACGCMLVGTPICQ